MTERKRIALLILILLAVVAATVGTSMAVLYRTSRSETEIQLVEMARNQARMAEACATQAMLTPGEDPAATVEALVDSVIERFNSIRTSSDLRFGRRQGRDLVFIAGHLPGPERLPLDSPLAEPMRRALAGGSGVCIAADLRGVPVLAAYEPIANLGWGVVAKIDLAEVQRPFLLAGAFITSVALVLTGIGAWWFVRVTSPIIGQLRDSEERLRRAVASAPFPIMIHGEDGKVAMTSRRWHELTGYAPEQMTTTAAWTALAYGAHHKTVHAEIGRLYDQSGRIDHGEHELTTADGGKRVWDFSSASLGRGADGRRLVISMAMDVTERKRAERALRANEERLGFAMGTSRIGLWELNLGDQTAFRTLEHDQIFGYRELLPSWTYGQFLEHVLDEDRAAVDSAFRRATTERSDWSFECRIRRSDGEVRWIWAAGRHLTPASGRADIIAGIVQDVTERHRAEDEVRSLNAGLEQRVRERTCELEAANRELEAFSYSVSHDLRSPLRSISGFSTALEEDCRDRLDANGLRNLAVIRRETVRMGELIDDLLRLSRLTRAPLAREVVDLSTLAAAVGEEVRQQHPGREVALAVAPGLHVTADPGMLRIVLENLLANAWKFTAKRAQARIAVGALPDGRPGFFVRDDGVGFDMAYADRLFGAFQRLHSQADFPGSGIGLATVARIVRRHGGSVRAEAAPDFGAAIFITLPC